MEDGVGVEAPERAVSTRRSTIREYVESLAIAIVLALAIRSQVVQAFKIPSGSMLQTLQIGDHILVNKFIYGIRLPFTDVTLIPVRAPKRRDVIVFRFPKDESKDFIKRVVGIPGDVIQVRNKALYVNGALQEEPYAIHDPRDAFPHSMPNRDNFGPVTVPADSYFVMGDNRDHSLDSRFWGFVDHPKIRGKAFLIYWSWDQEATWVRWDRIADIIQ